MAQKGLVDYSDRELREAYRASVTRTEYYAQDYWDELARRHQGRLATALTRWTPVMAIATAVNAGATLLLVLKALGYL
jgi:hypothetical protein